MEKTINAVANILAYISGLISIFSIAVIAIGLVAILISVGILVHMFIFLNLISEGIGHVF